MSGVKWTLPDRTFVLIAYCVIFVLFLLIADLLIYRQQEERLYSEFEGSNQVLVNLLTQLSRDAILSENYALLDWFLARWGQRHRAIVEIRVKSPTGFDVARYLDEPLPEKLSRYQEQITVDGEGSYSFRLGMSHVTVEKHLAEVRKWLGLVSTLAILLLGLIVWFLLKQLAIKPLELEVTRRKKTERELTHQQAFLQSVIDGVHDGVLVIDKHFRVLLSNHVIKQMIDPAYIADPDCPKCYEVSHHRKTPCGGDNHPCPLLDVLETKQHVSVIHSHPSNEGSPCYVELSASPYYDAQGEIQGIIESARDVTTHLSLRDELQRKKDYLEYLAHHDPLTGLPNRIMFSKHLGRAIRLAQRVSRQIAVLFVDLDQFKEINDSFDHSVGDSVLKEVAGRLNGMFREDDLVARMGGDEFTVILSNLSHTEDAGLVANKILGVLREPCLVGDRLLHLGASIGISLYPQHGKTVEDLVRNADSAMYQAKTQGRNCFHYYSEDLTRQAMLRIEMESALHTALAQDEFTLYYQPQFMLEDNAICGMEALVRWAPKNSDVVLPEKFIAIAEESRLMSEIDKVVMHKVFLQVKQWQDDRLISPDFPVSFNLSSRSFGSSGLVVTIKRIFEETGVIPDNLELELTESAIMRDVDQSARILDDLKKLGLRIAVDDFGTGCTSMAYLKSLPIARLKIDRVFIMGIPQDSSDVAITKAIVLLGQTLGLDMIAEGVETETQRRFLNEIGCQRGQGYLCSRPLPADQAESFLLNGI
jgi:diguanylate cyclase (GGDEF)-like protein